MFWLGKVKHWDLRVHEGRIECMLDLHGLLTNEWVRMLAQCCPTVDCCGNGFTAPRLELFYQPVREGAHSDGVSTCDSVKRKLNALEFGLLCNLLSCTWFFPSHTQIHFLSESQGCGWAVLRSGEPVLLQARWKERLGGDGFCSCHELSEVAAVSPE